MPLNPGQILNNRYRIVKLLGQGGFGAVYRAWDTRLSRPCAVKENLDTSAEAQRQFVREASMLANISHPNLPRVTDHFIIPEQGQYLVMDLVEGEDLETMLARLGGPLPEADAVKWIAQVCDALEYLHSQNPPVIHRDIKPANIKISSKGQAILVDFGIAKVYDPHLKTTVGARAVTPGYSPQEQYGHGATDTRTDIYALGATLYTLVTGRVPEESVQRTIGAHLVSPRSLDPRISVNTEQTILRAMEALPSRRFQDASNFRDALLGLAIPFQVATNVTVTSPLAAPSLTASPVAARPVPAPRSSPNRLWIAAIGILLLLFLAGAIGINSLLKTKPAKTQPAPTSEAAVLPVTTEATRLEMTSSPSPTRVIPPPQGTTAVAPNITATWTKVPPIPATPTRTSTPEPTITPSPDKGPTAGATLVSQADQMVLVYIPEGEFIMGSTDREVSAEAQEKPAHPVYQDAYWIDLTEVTNEMFEKFVSATGYRTDAEKGGLSYIYERETSQWHEAPGYSWLHPQGPSSSIDGRMNHPVIHVSWRDASAYCAWAGRRLPTEAEWEKAARGTDQRRYPWGDQAPSPNRLNYNYNINATTPVGSYPKGASFYGVLDMAGNVWEWIADWFSETYYSSSPYENPTGPDSSKYRAVRGGAWNSRDTFVRAANRHRWALDFRAFSTGFRCAKSALP